MKKLKLFLAFAIFIVAIPAFSANTDTPVYTVGSGFIDQIIDPYKVGGANLAQKILVYARGLFWLLAAVQFTGSGINLALKGADIQEWAAHLVRQIIFVGFYAWVMEHSYEFSMNIVDSFRQAGGGGQIHPQDIFNNGVSIAGKLLGAMSVWTPITSIVLGLSCVVIIIAFAWITAQLVVTLCEMYVLISAGVFFMGFGGSQWTSDIANKSMLMSVSIGAKIFVMEFLISIGSGIMSQWVNANFQDSYNVFSILGGTFVFVLLVQMLPNLAQQLISGAATGAMAGANIKSAVQSGVAGGMAAVGAGAAVKAALGAAGEGGGSASAALNASGGSTPPSSSGVAGAKMGGNLGLSNPVSSDSARPKMIGNRAGRVMSALAKGAKDEIKGRITGTGIRGGTTGGRIASYIKQNYTPAGGSGGSGGSGSPPNSSSSSSPESNNIS